MNKKLITTTILALIAFAALVTPLSVLGQSTNIGVYIAQVAPSSKTGSVGTAVNIQGSIFSPNGSYQVIFGKSVVTTGTSEGYYVNANFTVPEVAAGTYPIILRDTTINVNYSDQFTVTTTYAISADPTLVQEGNTVRLTVSLKGGESGKTYTANITVAPPNPAPEFSKVVSLGTADSRGSLTTQVIYPDSSFVPNGSLTDYVGTYYAAFNLSQQLAEVQFTVGFLDAASYHRGQVANIRATGYQSSQTATITITDKSGVSVGTFTATASAEGVLSASWTIPANVAIGDYTVKIAPDGTQKAVQDQQTLTVSGYAVSVKTTNIAGETVPEIVVRALDVTADAVYNATSGSDGIATLKLENGPHMLTAYWNDAKVGQMNITVSGAGSFTLTCLLTNLKITVENTQGIALPFIDLSITYTYATASGGSKSGDVYGQTDPTGSFILGATITQGTYTINASIYNQVFNVGNNTFTDLPEQAASAVTIVCPDKNITVNVVGYNQEPIPNARVELVELNNGLFYSPTTNSGGVVTAQVTFGMYRARVYKDNILINETTIEAFSNSQQHIHCTLYGIQVTVSVVDFFNNPVPNANVTLNGPAEETFSGVTQGDGKVTFSNIIGGNMQIVAYAPSTPDGYQAITLTVDQPMSVQVKIDKYIALGSMLIQVSALLTVVLIVVVAVLFVLVEVLRRRRRTKPAAVA